MSAPDDDELFREAMAGVAPIDKRARVRVTGERRAHPPPPEHPSFTEDGEATGHVNGVSRRQLNTLRAGKLAIDATMDLHRQTGDVARDTVVARVTEAAAAGARCVLIIHGRGAVLREVAIEALTTSLAHLVLAYCPARPRDGGAGALYVLLRRGTGPGSAGHRRA